MHKINIFIVCTFLTFVTVGFVSQRHSLACETIQFSGYDEVATNIYASPDLKNKNQILESILRVKKGSINIWGNDCFAQNCACCKQR